VFPLNRPGTKTLSLAAFLIAAAILAHPVLASAQDEAAVRSALEGRRVTVTIDMPGSEDGVDIQADSSRPLDYQRYGERLKAYGTAIRAGETATVTLVKIKKDLIEFQLGGGGFGTFSDDTSTSVPIRLVEKSERERTLEKTVRKEDDPRRRRELERELNDLRARREGENRRLEALRVAAEERKRARIADERLRGGSRFNLRYEGRVPPGITATEVVAALASYVDFGGGAAGTLDAIDAGPAVVISSRSADDVVPRKGMSRAAAEQALGRAVESSMRQEGRVQIETAVFVRGDERITAEFAEGVLIRYAIASR
jgi:hypothetical protein